MEIQDSMTKQNEELAAIKKLSIETLSLIDAATKSSFDDQLDLVEDDEEEPFNPNEYYKKLIDEYIRVVKPWENVTGQTEETEE